MAPPRRPDAEIKRLAEQILSHPTHESAATALNLSQAQVARIVYSARAKGLIAPEGVNYTPAEVRDAQFWKAKARFLEKELAETQHTLNEVSGLMARPVQPPQWALPKSSGKQNRAAGLLHISDIHAGEVVSLEETNGVNQFDLDICRTRLRRLFGAAIDILPRWSSDCRLTGIFVALNGDLVSGSIHEELIETNAITSHNQVWFVADELAAGIQKLADTFGHVTAITTCGNHGRSTKKMQAKRTAQLSFDTTVGEALRRHFSADKRVTVIVSPSRDAEYNIFQWRILQTHHDQGGGGGQGWAGPILPIARKVKSIEWMNAQVRVFHDLTLTAHHHAFSMPTWRTCANGSIVGFNEFARSIRASPEPPVQGLYLIHERWGVREMMGVKLATPRPGA